MLPKREMKYSTGSYASNGSLFFFSNRGPLNLNLLHNVWQSHTHKPMQAQACFQSRLDEWCLGGWLPCVWVDWYKIWLTSGSSSCPCTIVLLEHYLLDYLGSDGPCASCCICCYCLGDLRHWIHMIHWGLLLHMWSICCYCCFHVLSGYIIATKKHI